MKLEKPDLETLCAFAVGAAKKAGAMIQSYQGQQIEVQHKVGGDSLAAQVLTEVDLKSEAIILECLNPLCEQYELALLSEESTDDKARLEQDYFWCIDPMDGTLSFVEGVAGYAVSIALVSRDAEPQIGVVFDPVSNTCYSAIKGLGVRRNEKTWQVSPRDGGELRLICDRGFIDKPYFSKIVENLTQMAQELGYDGLLTLEKNGAVLNALTVFEHPPSLYFKFPKPQQGGGSLWDFAATAAIAGELGFIGSDFYGQALDLNRPDSTYMNHKGVLYCMDARLADKIKSLAGFCA